MGTCLHKTVPRLRHAHGCCMHLVTNALCDIPETTHMLQHCGYSPPRGRRGLDEGFQQQPRQRPTRPSRRVQVLGRGPIASLTCSSRTCRSWQTLSHTQTHKTWASKVAPRPKSKPAMGQLLPQPPLGTPKVDPSDIPKTCWLRKKLKRRQAFVTAADPVELRSRSRVRSMHERSDGAAQSSTQQVSGRLQTC